MVHGSVDWLTANNPWLNLPTTGNLVLPGDRHGADGFELRKVPVPWSGPAFTAAVLVLALNPGLGGDDLLDQFDPSFHAMVRDQLTGTSPFPWCAAEWSRTGGGRYWTPRLRDVIGESSVSAVKTNFAVVEYVAYSSRQWVEPAALLESQLFTRRVVQAALRRNAAIVVARALRRWTWLVPELIERPPIRLRSPRYVGLTPRNLEPGDYEAILRRLSH